MKKHAFTYKSQKSMLLAGKANMQLKQVPYELNRKLLMLYQGEVKLVKIVKVLNLCPELNQHLPERMAIIALVENQQTNEQTYANLNGLNHATFYVKN